MTAWLTNTVDVITHLKEFDDKERPWVIISREDILWGGGYGFLADVVSYFLTRLMEEGEEISGRLFLVFDATYFYRQYLVETRKDGAFFFAEIKPSLVEWENVLRG